MHNRVYEQQFNSILTRPECIIRQLIWSYTPQERVDSNQKWDIRGIRQVQRAEGGQDHWYLRDGTVQQDRKRERENVRYVQTRVSCAEYKQEVQQNRYDCIITSESHKVRQWVNISVCVWIIQEWSIQTFSKNSYCCILCVCVWKHVAYSIQHTHWATSCSFY